MNNMNDIQEKEEKTQSIKIVYGYIYKITNKINQKIYIGQTSRTIAIRWKSHCYTAFCEKSKDYDFPLYRAIRKYGIENFLVEEIDQAFSQEELDQKEIQYIEEYDSYRKGYNASLGGSGHQKYNYLEITKYYLAHKSLLETCKHFQIYDQVVYSALAAMGVKPQKREKRTQPKKVKNIFFVLKRNNFQFYG